MPAGVTDCAMTETMLGEEIFSAYAAGALSGPMTLLLDVHTVVSPAVAAERARHDALAGFLLQTETPVAMREGALDDILAIIDAEASQSGEAAMRALPGNDVRERKAASLASRALDEILALPEPVRDLVLEQGGNWQFAGPGVRTMELMRDGPAKAELIRLEPGHGVPRHTHDGREFTLVLCGAFHDGHARYGRGDMSVADPELTHRPVAEAGEVCIALAVTDGPLAFTGPLGWVQRALGGMN